MNSSVIQIWNSFRPICIKPDGIGDKFRIFVRKPVKNIPDDLERRVNEKWEACCKENHLLKDNEILFLAEPVKSNGYFSTVTETRMFRYSQVFNRTKAFYELKEELRKYKLLYLGTHCHILTKDNKLLFGTKKNQFNQISGFSGIPQSQADIEQINNDRFLNVYTTIKNRLWPEIGYLVHAVDSIHAIGITFVGTPGLRGVDSDYLIQIDETAARAIKRFKESDQFKKDLFAVDFEPKKMMEFVKKMHENNKTMSRYALGCMYLETKAFFGEKEAEKFLKTVQEGLGISMSTRNETNYFS